MEKVPNLQKWAFRFLSLLVVAMATFFGEVFITTRAAPLAPRSQVPASCALEHTAGAGTKIFVPSNLGPTITNALGSGTSSTYSLNCTVNTVGAPNLDPNGHTFTVGGVTYDHLTQPDKGNSPDALGKSQFDQATDSTFQKITVNNPSEDKITWNFANLNLPAGQKFTFAIHTYQNTSKLQFKLNGGDPTVGLQTNKFQAVFSAQQGVNKIVMDFSGVSAGTIVQVGDFFVGHTATQ